MYKWVSMTNWNVDDFLIKYIILSNNNITHYTTPLHLIMAPFNFHVTEIKAHIYTSLQSPQCFWALCCDIHHYGLRVGMLQVWKLILFLNKTMPKIVTTTKASKQMNMTLSVWYVSSGLLCILPVAREQNTIHHLAVPGRRPTASWCWSYQGKHNTVKHWMDQHFTYIARHRARSTSVLDIGPLWPEGLSWQPAQSDWPMLPPVLTQLKEPWLFSCGVCNTESWGCAWGPRIYMLRRNKGTLLCLKQGKIFPHKVISLVQAVWTLYFLVRNYSRPKAHWYAAKWWWKDCTKETAFPNSTIFLYLY